MNLRKVSNKINSTKDFLFKEAHGQRPCLPHCLEVYSSYNILVADGIINLD